MNLISLFSGDIVATATQEIGSRFIHSLMSSNVPKFLDNLKQAEENRKLSIADFDLSQIEEKSLTLMRETAMARGMESLEVEINGQRYLMEVKDFSFVPILKAQS